MRAVHDTRSIRISAALASQRTREWRRTFCRVGLFVTLFQPAIANAYTPAEIDAAAAAAHDVAIAKFIAGDFYAGRNNDTVASTAIQTLLVEQLKGLGSGLNASQTGDDRYKQPFATAAIGTNLLAVIPGSALPNEYVMVGAHFDHLGVSGSDIYNGATDNAAGVAAVLAVGAAVKALPTPPQRSVILAVWDAEEDGLVGSEFFKNNPLVPLSSIKSYVNFDIQGANLLPSLRDVSFLVGSESGGLLQSLLLLTAVQNSPLNFKVLSRLFGQDRSDHASFIDDGVPVVFFTDATGSCYHTPGDDPSVVDLAKLAEQSEVAFRLLVGLTEAASPPVFVSTMLFASVYQDAVRVLDVIDLAIDDLSLFPPADQTTILDQQAIVQGIVNAGPGAFTSSSGISVALAADALLTSLEALPCDGFVIHHVPASGAPQRAAIAVLLAGFGAALARRFARAG